MTTALEKLASIGGPEARPMAARGELAAVFGQELTRELMHLLEKKNGFHAFDSALHVFSDRNDSEELGLIAWNSPDLWRHAYDGMADGFIFFAEDVFGGQFCLAADGIHIFEPETGETEKIGDTMEQWAERILESHDILTGCALAREWRIKYGKIPAGTRLVPKTPFVLGGRYEIANLHALDATKGMRFRAGIATQIRDLPDGASIKLTVVD